MLLVPPGIARAQTLDDYIPECFGGNQLPCKSYTVFDAILLKQVGGSIRNHQGEDSNGNLLAQNTTLSAGLEVGQMWNRGMHNSFGGTIEYDHDDAGQGRLAVKARARRWFSPVYTLDVAAGVVGETVFQPGWVTTECGTCTESGYGLTADATIGFKVLGVTVAADAIRGYGRTMTSVRAGGRAGGILGLAAAAVVAVWGAAAGAAF